MKHKWMIIPMVNKSVPKHRWWRNLNNDELLLLHEIYCDQRHKAEKFTPHYLFASPNTSEYRLQIEKDMGSFRFHMKERFGGRWDVLEQTSALELYLQKRGYVDILELKDRTLILGVTDLAIQELLWYRNPLLFYGIVIGFVVPLVSTVMSFGLSLINFK